MLNTHHVICIVQDKGIISFCFTHTHTHHNHDLSAQVSQNSELTPATRGTCCTTGLTQSHNILYVQLVACGNLMKGALAICEQQKHVKDLWSAANNPGLCSIVLSNLPCGSSRLYLCSAYLWDSERVRRSVKISSFLVGAIKVSLSSIAIFMFCLSLTNICDP